MKMQISVKFAKKSMTINMLKIENAVSDLSFSLYW